MKIDYNQPWRLPIASEQFDQLVRQASKQLAISYYYAYPVGANNRIARRYMMRTELQLFAMGVNHDSFCVSRQELHA